MKKQVFLFFVFILSMLNVNAQCEIISKDNFEFSASGQTGTGKIDYAFDGDLENKWEHQSTGEKYLQVIFDSPAEICKIVIYHAEGGNTTQDYRILAFNYGKWIEVIKVTNNTQAITTHEVTPFAAYALRLEIDKGGAANADLAGICEFEIYGKFDSELTVKPMRRVYPHQSEVSSQFGDELPTRVFDGDLSNRWSSGNESTKWLRMDFLKPVKIGQVVIYHSGGNWITRNFSIQANHEGTWNSLVSVNGNSRNISTHEYTGDIASDQIRLHITQAEQNGNGAARIAEMELYAEYDAVEGNPVEENKVYTIYPYVGDKVVSVENSSKNSSAKVVANTNADVNAQRWRVIKNGDYYNFQNAYTGMYLAADSYSGLVSQTSSNMGVSAQWLYEPVEGENNCYYLIHYKGGYLNFPLDIENSQLVISPSRENVKGGRVWKFVEAPNVPNEFTAELRDEIIGGWLDKYYMPARTNQNWGGVGHVIERPGFWDTAENMEIFLDAYETTRDVKYRDMYNEIFDNFKATQYTNGWQYNDFNDDIAWLVIGMIRAHLLFGDTDDTGKNRDYKALAKYWFDLVYERALIPDTRCSSGLLLWKQGLTTTNSCVNGPMQVAACYIGKAYEDESYFEKARNLYALQRRDLTNLPTDGRVWDSWDCMANNGEGARNYWASTYNQGTFLGAAVLLWQHYGDKFSNGTATTYKEDAKKVIEYSIGNNFCTNGVIHVCPQGNDLAGFKGILMRYVRNYVEIIPDNESEKYTEWMKTNVLHAYNNRNSHHVSWTAWREKTLERGYRTYMDNDNTAYQYYGAFGTGTHVSAAVNVPGYGPEDPTGIPELEIDATSTVKIWSDGNRVTVNSAGNDPIQRIDVYDLQERKIFSQLNIDDSSTSFTLPVVNSIVIIRVRTNNTVESFKLMIR